MSGTVLGLAGALGAVDRVIGGVDYLRRRATLDVLGREIVNYNKVHGPYKDRTHKLREGNAHEVLDTNYAGIPAPVLIVANRMHYAVHVEDKNNLWVVSGGVNELRPGGALRDVVASKMRVGSRAWHDSNAGNL